MQSRPFAPARRGFTLVELLIVVSIIGVLASIAFPAFGQAMNAAKKTQASAMANQLKTAVYNFYTDYGYYPTQPQRQEIDNKELYRILIGKDQDKNPRGIAYMEFKANDLDNPVTPTMYVDPWYKSVKSAAQNYHILVDYNYDNQIDLVEFSKDGPAARAVPAQITASVAVWDPGIPQRAKSTAPIDPDPAAVDPSAPASSDAAGSGSESASGDSAAPPDDGAPVTGEPLHQGGWLINRISNPKIIKTW